MPAESYAVTHWEDADLVVMARIKGLDRQNIVQATISSITMKVYEVSSGDQVGSDTALTVSSVIFDTLQTDARWTRDSTGYNFRYTVSGDFFPSGNTDYWVEFEFTPTTGSMFPVVWEVSAKNRRGG